MREHLASTIRAAIKTSPGRARALARAANVSHVTLVKIVAGTLYATPEIANRLADALEDWGETCRQSARDLRKAARQATPRVKGAS